MFLKKVQDVSTYLRTAAVLGNLWRSPCALLQAQECHILLNHIASSRSGGGSLSHLKSGSQRKKRTGTVLRSCCGRCTAHRSSPAGAEQGKAPSPPQTRLPLPALARSAGSGSASPAQGGLIRIIAHTHTPAGWLQSNLAWGIPKVAALGLRSKFGPAAASREQTKEARPKKGSQPITALNNPKTEAHQELGGNWAPGLQSMSRVPLLHPQQGAK